MLAIGLAHIKALDISGVPSQLVTEKLSVVVQIPVIKTQTKLFINLLGPPLDHTHRWSDAISHG